MSSAGGEVAVASLALLHVLGEAVEPVPRARVVIGPPRPATLDTDPIVGLHLFRVDAASPTRALSPRGGAAATPRARTWELDYVISSGGDSARVVPEILLGLVVDALEATPIVLPAAGIASFQALVPELELSSRIESIRVAPLALTGTQRAAWAATTRWTSSGSTRS